MTFARIHPVFVWLSLVLTPAAQVGCSAQSVGRTGQVAAVVEIGIPIAGTYQRTHGQFVTGEAMPYVEEYAEANRIDLRRVQEALFPDGLPQSPNRRRSGALISSYEYVTGEWTYVKSETVRFYELLQVQVGNRPEPRYLILYNRALPDQVIIDQFEAQWRLAMLTETYEVLAEEPFTTRIQYEEEGLWDTIYTKLAVEEGHVVSVVMYAHSGGGGGRDQEFTFQFRVTEEPFALTLYKAEQTLDDYEED